MKRTKSRAVETKFKNLIGERLRCTLRGFLADALLAVRNAWRWWRWRWNRTTNSDLKQKRTKNENKNIEPSCAAVDTFKVGVGIAGGDLGTMTRWIARVQTVVEMHGIGLAGRDDTESWVAAVARRRRQSVEAVDRRLHARMRGTRRRRQHAVPVAVATVLVDDVHVDRVANEVVRRRRAANCRVSRDIAIRRADAELRASLRSALVVLGDERQELAIDRKRRRTAIARNEIRANRRNHIATFIFILLIIFWFFFKKKTRITHLMVEH